MTQYTLISARELLSNLGKPNLAIIDCRFSLTDSDYGRRDYLAAHIPGALYADLIEDLSGHIIPGKTSRHPLPEITSFTDTLSGWGIDENVKVIAYDDVGGALAASRLWWMLRWLGHANVVVLDGGWEQWIREGYPTRSGIEIRSRREFIPTPHPDMIVNAEEVEALRCNPNYRLLDSRTKERYQGENETIDPVAGHIPGAQSAPYLENLDDSGRFLPPKVLKKRFEKLLNGVDPERTIFYCGSGVTAAHNVLALAHSGLGDTKLYVGSWSEWITDPDRPIGKSPSK